MSPVIDIVWAQALTPYLDGDMEFQATLCGTGTVAGIHVFSDPRHGFGHVC